MSAVPQNRQELIGSSNNDLISIKSIKAFPRRYNFSGNPQNIIDLDNQQVYRKDSRKPVFFDKTHGSSHRIKRVSHHRNTKSTRNLSLVEEDSKSHFKRKKGRGSLLRKHLTPKNEVANMHFSQSLLNTSDPMQLLKAQYSAANYDSGEYAHYGASPKNDYFKSMQQQNPKSRLTTF